jgi:hypothetical protein
MPTFETYCQIATLCRRIDPIPNIVGPAFGAAMCDTASRAVMGLFMLRIGVGDTLDIAHGEDELPTGDIRDQQRDLSWPPLGARNVLRARAGIEALPLDTRLGNRHRLLPLTAAEHLYVGADIKIIHEGLVRVGCALGKFGRLPRLAKTATRQLLTLRSRLDSVVCREFPDGINGEPPTHVYFGAR